MSRAPIFVAGAALVAAGLALGTPAAAADLPQGETIFVIADGNIYTAETDGTVTEVADMPDGDILGADVDPTSGLVYFVVNGDPETACQLWTLNLTTLVTDEIGDLEFNRCDGLDVASDGTLRVGNNLGVISTIDKADASTISDITVTPALAWIAEGPGGQFYIGDYAGNLYTLNTSTGATVNVGQPTFFWDSGDFDSAGTLWATSRTGPEGCQGLASLSLSDPEESYLFEGDFLEDGTCTPVTALFIVPPPAPPTPALPATGPVAVLPLSALAGVAVLAGLIVLIRSRRTA